ncbi:MAG: hypothetical protein MZV64_63765 [Ignavibacteriales bacterium]|nr:hypothetical protein [Ignavibacteriales bacterium]
MTTTLEKAAVACKDADVIVAMGGDGTVADTLQGIFDAGRQNDVLFGVIPFGSGNAFRKVVRHPQEPPPGHRPPGRGRGPADRPDGGRGARRRVRQHRRHGPGDRREAPGQDPRPLGPRPGRPAALRHAHEREDGRAHRRHRPLGAVRRKTVTSRFFDCIVAKTNHFGYSWNIAPQAIVDDGYIDVTLFEIGPLKYAFFFPLIYLGPLPAPLPALQGQTVVISGRDMPIQFNGEFLGDRDRIEFRILPLAIRMIIPPTRRAARRFQKPMNIRGTHTGGTCPRDRGRSHEEEPSLCCPSFSPSWRPVRRKSASTCSARTSSRKWSSSKARPGIRSW